MSQVPAGWFDDPYGRFQQRYWDGARWTEHVATEGRAMVDPMGASAVVPFATPASATDGAAASEVAEQRAEQSTGVIGLLDRTGVTARERTRPSIGSAVAGLGGVVVAIGVLEAVTGEQPVRGEFIAGSLIVLAVAFAARLYVRIAEAQSAAIGLAAVGVVAFGASVSVTDSAGGFLTGLLIAALFLSAWALPGFQGVNMFLASGLLALLAGFGSLSSDAGGDGGLLPTEITGTVGTQGAVYLVGAALFLGATWALDRRGYRGTATAFAAAGLVASLIGTVLLVSRFGDTSGPIFVTIVGALVCLVGSHGQRRATTWAGAALLTAGFMTFLAIQFSPSSTGSVATVAILGGLALVLMPVLGASIRRTKDAQRSGPPVQP